MESLSVVICIVFKDHGKLVSCDSSNLPVLLPQAVDHHQY